MESCSGSHWLARKWQKFGYKVLLIPQQYVKPCVKTHKNDFIDTAAITEVATRPSMHFVTVKTETFKWYQLFNVYAQATWKVERLVCH